MRKRISWVSTHPVAGVKPYQLTKIKCSMNSGCYRRPLIKFFLKEEQHET